MGPIRSARARGTRSLAGPVADFYTRLDAARARARGRAHSVRAARCDAAIDPMPASAPPLRLGATPRTACVLLALLAACSQYRTRDAAAPLDAADAGDDLVDAPAPPPADAGLRVTQLALGSAHSCALVSDGTLRCWGSNTRGQVGIGTTDDRIHTPQVVTNIAGGATAVIAGGFNTCALLATGAPRCWGENISGELALGMPPPGASREPVPTLSANVTQIALGGALNLVGTDAGRIGGATNCAVFAGSAPQVQCWGANLYGSAGSGTPMQPVFSPATVPLNSPRAVAVGSKHACAITANGVLCWGDNDDAQLGNGERRTMELAPVVVRDLPPDVVALALGGEHSCALVPSGGARAAYCWGQNGLGDLGLGHDSPVSTPQRLTFRDALAPTQLAVGTLHSCARMADGTVQCWGLNSNGQLGDGTREDRNVPTPVPGLTDVESVAVGTSHTCAVRRDGEVLCWGFNYSGQLGFVTTGERRETPTRVSVL